MKGVLFWSKLVYWRVRVLTSRQSLSVQNFNEYLPPRLFLYELVFSLNIHLKLLYSKKIFLILKSVRIATGEKEPTLHSTDTFSYNTTFYPDDINCSASDFFMIH